MGKILQEAHGSRYSIHYGLTRYMVEFVGKCPNCKHVKVEPKRPGVLTHVMDVPTWKRDEIIIDIVVGLPQTQAQNDSILVIVD